MTGVRHVVLGVLIGALATAAYYRGHPYAVTLDKGTFVEIIASQVTAFNPSVTTHGSTYIDMSDVADQSWVHEAPEQ